MTIETPHRWTHAICQECWIAHEPKRRWITDQSMLAMMPREVCCFCGMVAVVVYYRADPSETLCEKGEV